MKDPHPWDWLVLSKKLKKSLAYLQEKFDNVLGR